VNFTGTAPPLGFRRLTQETEVAQTAQLFQTKHAPLHAAKVDASNCKVLMRLLERAEASALLLNFLEAEFNDNDGACAVPMQQ
jgi:hypothetical protein